MKETKQCIPITQLHNFAALIKLGKVSPAHPKACLGEVVPGGQPLDLPMDPSAAAFSLFPTAMGPLGVGAPASLKPMEIGTLLA